MLTYVHKLIDKNQGSISISDFMNAALYHKEYGYYMSKLPLGKDGDFITAPEISRLFCEIIAVWVMHTWEKLGKPSKFSLVELGPGKGTLIHDVIRVARKYNDFFDSVSVHLVEISPALQKIQKEKLKGLDINWHENIDSLPKRPAIFLANEFFDAFPIDQFVYRNGEWYENRVTKKDNGASLQCLTLKSRKKDGVIPAPLSRYPSAFFLSFPPSLSSKVADTEVQEKESCVLASATQMTNRKLFDGAVVEVCSAGIEIIKRLEEKIYNSKGAALIIDYGYVYPEYKSTLQSVKQHKYANFLENVGNSDITALVNFQALRDSLKHVDCEILTQREFLYLFGIKERTQTLMKNASDKQKNRIFGEFLRLTENMGTLFKAMLIHHL
ncbi:class I SAM-dependent methyltransferase [Wolbachia endosymbiont of Mansonella perstans]|uniref:class I SAM-dependent methyltransferase n=1 Tax=Wolbachia endosymbiont of Mansonella perstans TaxID=229526 RepID=UPI001CE1C28D|nr:SAM-dependent methyltransferase [Wolbachia endosymbiont of Mansonella perstans]MCA4773816.1 SAM-dependent methyltransferase [Wolbachia endosymbiont of Mansonella perstans]